MGKNQSDIWKRFGLPFKVKSVRFLEVIQAAVRGKNQSDFWKRFGLLFAVKSVQFLEEVQAAIRGEISLVFGRDSVCCLG